MRLWNVSNKIQCHFIQKLDDSIKKQHAPWSSHISTRESYGEAKLQIIVGPDGRMTLPKTSKQRDLGRKVGTAVN